MIEGYLTIKELAEKWGVTRRRVQALCSRGRIPGATRFGHEWAIPSDAERPTDGRITTGKYRNWRKKGGKAMIENIKVFTQSSIMVQSRFGSIYFDPFRMNVEPHDARYIFVTHDHYDHFSPEDIEKVCSCNTILIVPEKMEGKARETVGSVKEIKTVKPGIFQELNGLEFETVPSYNVMKAFHPRSAGWVGYILRIDGQRIYIAGDTDATKEAREVKCDIALVPIGGTYTMDAKKAAELINDIHPKVAIPTHYGSIVGKQSDEEVFAKHVKDPVKVEFKISF